MLSNLRLFCTLVILSCVYAANVCAEAPAISAEARLDDMQNMRARHKGGHKSASLSKTKAREMYFNTYKVGQFDAEEIIYPVNFSANKATVIIYMTSWCHHCINELRELEIVAPELKRAGIEIIPVFTDIDLQQVNQIFDNPKIGNRIEKLGRYVDTKGMEFGRLGGKGIPTTMIVDQTGETLALIHAKFIPWSKSTPEQRASVEGILQFLRSYTRTQNLIPAAAK